MDPCWWKNPLPYQVVSPDGSILYQSLETERHPPRIERQLIDAGCSICLNGKKITQKELSRRVGKKTAL